MLAKQLCAVLTILQIIPLIAAVRITSLSVPKIVPWNVSSVIMDCEYNLPEDGWAGLVVKWYVDGVHLVYQWIPPGVPQAIGILSDRVDTSYIASRDKLSKYRAIYIKKVDPSISGDYSCTVSTLEDEDTRTGHMDIWAPADRLTVNYWRFSVDSVNVTCRADRVAPQPHFTLYLLYPDGSRADLEIQDVTKTHVGGGLWDVSVWGHIDWLNTPSTTVIGCRIKIRGTNYKSTAERFYNPSLPIITTTTTTSTTTTHPLHLSNLANSVPTSTSGLLDFSSLFGQANGSSKKRFDLLLKCCTLILVPHLHWLRFHLLERLRV